MAELSYHPEKDYWIVQNESGTIIANVTDENDAQELVKRWNEHDSLKAKADSVPALVKACKEALPIVERHSLSAARIQRLKAALAAVKE